MAYESNAENHLDAVEARLVERYICRMDYVKDIVQGNLPALREAFGVTDLPPEEEARELFHRTDAALQQMDVEATVGTVVPHAVDDGPSRHEPLERMGWITTEPLESPAGYERVGILRYVVRVTDSGLGLLNGLRAACGEISVEEQRAKTRAAQLQQLERVRQRRAGINEEA